MASPSALVNEDDVHYTVLVRLPFPRGDFVDPPAVSCIGSIQSRHG